MLASVVVSLPGVGPQANRASAASVQGAGRRDGDMQGAYHVQSRTRGEQAVRGSVDLRGERGVIASSSGRAAVFEPARDDDFEILRSNDSRIEGMSAESRRHL